MRKNLKYQKYVFMSIHPLTVKESPFISLITWLFKFTSNSVLRLYDMRSDMSFYSLVFYEP